jgi:uncharacterized protein
VSTAALALVAGAGLVGGFVNAIAGGGSLLLFPALVASGLGTVPANVTNSVALWPGYVGNVAALGADSRPRRAQASLYATAAVGSAVGCVLLLATPASAFSAVVPFLVIAASLLLAAQPRLKRWLGTHDSGHSRPGHLHAGVFGGGVYGGYFGGGLGVIFMAVLGLAMVATIREVNGLKALLQLLVATVTVVVFSVFGPVHWLDVLLIAPASLLGGVVGGRLARRLSERLLRLCVVVFGLAVGTWLAVRAFG